MTRDAPISRDALTTTEDLRSDGGEGNCDDLVERYAIDPDERPTDAVIRAVSTFTDRDPLSLEPLAHRIDPDALDAVFGLDAPTVEHASIEFTFGGCVVTVEPDVVLVREADEGTDRSDDGEQ